MSHIEPDPDHVRCRELVELVTDYLEGALAERERVAVEEHLVLCGGCLAYFDQIRDTIRLSRALAAGGASDAGAPSVAPAVRDTLLRAFRARKPGRGAG